MVNRTSKIQELKFTKINTTLTLKGHLHFKAFITNLNLYCSEINVINIKQKLQYSVSEEVWHKGPSHVTRKLP